MLSEERVCASPRAAIVPKIIAKVTANTALVTFLVITLDLPGVDRTPHAAKQPDDGKGFALHRFSYRSAETRSPDRTAMAHCRQ